MDLFENMNENLSNIENLDVTFYIVITKFHYSLNQIQNYKLQLDYFHSNWPQ